MPQWSHVLCGVREAEVARLSGCLSSATLPKCPHEENISLIKARRT